MPRPELVDLYFSSEGDFCFDQAKQDIKDTSLVRLRNRVQQADTRLRSNKGDWRFQSSVGADMGDFFGAPNSAATGAALKQRVLSELTRDGLFSIGELVVEAVPLSRDVISVFIWATPVGSTDSMSLTYDLNIKANSLVPRSN